MKNEEMARLFSEATPYIQKYHGRTMVIKYGGNAMINETLKNAVMNDLVTLTLLGVRVVLVHGGGPAINEMLKKVGVESHFANGLRVTDDATMEIVQQVLAGKVNKDLVAKLRGRGVGLCGMDGQMLRCTELDPQLGHVGEIVHVDATLIESLLDGGFIPVIATVGMDDLGQAYNVNADTAAAQIAIALKAEKLVSMTDIAGLLRDKEDETTLIPEVEVTEIEGYKYAGIIAGRTPSCWNCSPTAAPVPASTVAATANKKIAQAKKQYYNRKNAPSGGAAHARNFYSQEVHLWILKKSSSGTTSTSCTPITATPSCWKRGTGCTPRAPRDRSIWTSPAASG